MTPPINSVSDHILDGIASGDLAASPFEVVSIAKELAARRAANTPVGGEPSALQEFRNAARAVADHIDEFGALFGEDYDRLDRAADAIFGEEMSAASCLIGAGWETHSLKEKQRLQQNAGIPHLPTDMTYEARLAVAGEGPRGFEWSDKKHRLVYDLCREIERIAATHPAPSASSEVTVTDEMVERAAQELLAHGEFSSIPWRNHDNALKAARAALLAALREREG